jgi:hypothetical protein
LCKSPLAASLVDVAAVGTDSGSIKLGVKDKSKCRRGATWAGAAGVGPRLYPWLVGRVRCDRARQAASLLSYSDNATAIQTACDLKLCQSQSLAISSYNDAHKLTDASVDNHLSVSWCLGHMNIRVEGMNAPTNQQRRLLYSKAPPTSLPLVSYAEHKKSSRHGPKFGRTLRSEVGM